ncbi:hypothetical protein [Photobacterium damselae]|uniref:hypothetical protein n=1 Tax=Photobacterium damselae TaxID=38293 RepID=UPI000D663212|nr:hypothetical protein [Photobacterium damselae]AWK83526.1 hypothetical protein BST98_15990 [Photobacterium damselae]NVH47350.1 hypothetical protein [Photobacterium damselae subsp. damselae]
MSDLERPLVITDVMRKSIEIKHFIYHILLKESDNVDYLMEVSLTDNQKDFFRDMIAEASRGTKYDFIDRELSEVALSCEKILSDDGEANFVKCSEKLAHIFKAKHDKRMASGIVVVTSFSMQVNTNRRSFIALLKLDYKAVLQQVRDEVNPKKVSFQEITDSLLEDKSAIQKRAVIDVGNTFEWDVIAIERGKTSAKQDTDCAIGDHFREFLNVRLKSSNSAIMRNVIAQTKKWADNQEDLIGSDIKVKVINYLEANNDLSVNIDEIRDLICIGCDEAHTEHLKRSFNEHMDQVELNGIEFISRANSIPKKEREFKLKTNKNVCITWTGEMDKAGIIKDESGDQVKIIITASKINEIY